MSSTRIERRITSKGISYLTLGPEKSYQCIVCVHGWACQASDFTPMLELLSNAGTRWRLIAIDLPGHGKTSIEHYPNGSLTTMTEAILDLIRDLRANEVVLAGHSMGMRAILSSWQQLQTIGQPKVKGLVFLDGSHYRLRKSLFAFDSGDARSRNLSDDEKIAAMEDAFNRMLSSSTPENFRISALKHVSSMDLAISDGMRKSFIAFDFEKMDRVLEALWSYKVQVMSLQATDVDGENQRITLEQGEWSVWMWFLQEKVPQATQFVIANSSHFPHVDQPVEVAARIHSFLDDL